MDPSTIAIVLCIFAVAAFFKGVTGLGFSTTALPPLALTIGIKEAMPLLLLPSITSNTIVMIKSGNMVESLKNFRWMYVCAILGVIVGVSILSTINTTTAGMILGPVMILYCCFGLLKPDFSISDSIRKPLQPVIGLTTGVINGITGSQVMPVLPYLLALKLSPTKLVQVSNLSFTLSSLTMILGLWKIGLFTPQTLMISVLGLIPVFVGVRFGAQVRDHLSPELFKRAVIIFLGLSGIVLLAKPLLSDL